MKHFFPLLVMLFFVGEAVAQEQQQPEPIQTDRPDQTETPALVPKGMFQMENGFLYQKENDDENSLVTPTVLAKYGVNENFELRLIIEYNTIESAGQKTSGFNPILIGTKIKMCEEKGIVPKTSFIGHLLIPKFASEDFKADYYATEFRFVMQHTLAEKLSLSYNLGAEWDGISPDATFIYTLATGFTFTDKLGGYAELFGFAPQNDTANHNFDGGLTYLLSNNMMLDVSAGVGLTENAPDYFVSCGFSFRI